MYWSGVEESENTRGGAAILLKEKNMKNIRNEKLIKIDIAYMDLMRMPKNYDNRQMKAQAK